MTPLDFKNELIMLDREAKRINSIMKPYNIYAAPNIYNSSCLMKMLKAFNFETDEQITMAIKSIIDDLPLQSLNDLVGYTNTLHWDKSKRHILPELEGILIDEMLKRKMHSRLKLKFLYKSINVACKDYMINNCLDIFFKSTNNVRDIVKLLEKTVITTNYKDEYFDKFYKILTSKNININKECSIDSFNRIRPFIRKEHIVLFDSILMMFNLS